MILTDDLTIQWMSAFGKGKKGRGKKGSDGKGKGDKTKSCFSCGRQGPIRAECWAPGGPKEKGKRMEKASQDRTSPKEKESQPRESPSKANLRMVKV